MRLAARDVSLQLIKRNSREEMRLRGQEPREKRYS